MICSTLNFLYANLKLLLYYNVHRVLDAIVHNPMYMTSIYIFNVLYSWYRLASVSKTVNVIPK